MEQKQNTKEDQTKTNELPAKIFKELSWIAYGIGGFTILVSLLTNLDVGVYRFAFWQGLTIVVLGYIISQEKIWAVVAVLIFLGLEAIMKLAFYINDGPGTIGGAVLYGVLTWYWYKWYRELKGYQHKPQEEQ